MNEKSDLKNSPILDVPGPELSFANSSDSPAETSLFDHSTSTVISVFWESSECLSVSSSNDKPPITLSWSLQASSTPKIFALDNKKKLGRPLKAQSLERKARASSIGTLAEFVNAKKRKLTNPEPNTSLAKKEKLLLNRSFSSPSDLCVLSTEMEYNIQTDMPPTNSTIMPSPMAPIAQTDANLLENLTDRDLMNTILAKVNELCISGQQRTDALVVSMNEGNSDVKRQLDDLKILIETRDAEKSQQIAELSCKISTLEVKLQELQEAPIPPQVIKRIEKLEEVSEAASSTVLKAEIVNLKRLLNNQEREIRSRNIVKH